VNLRAPAREGTRRTPPRGRRVQAASRSPSRDRGARPRSGRLAWTRRSTAAQSVRRASGDGFLVRRAVNTRS